MAETRRTLYPPVAPFDDAMLAVSGLHTVHYEQAGNPDGAPALFVHGGPGGGVEPVYRRFFDPEHYRVVLFDQRGCGKSTPHAELRENTTWDLIADMERIRETLGIEKWLVFGGSWGSTLALAYAMAHPERVTALVLRGVFTIRKAEIAWFYQAGADRIFPDAWERYLAPIPENERGDMVTAYHQRLISDDRMVRMKAARAWAGWEGATLSFLPDPPREARFAADRFAEAFARIECHYFINGGFFEQDGWLLRPENVSKIRHIAGVIVQGRYDICTPMRTAWDLHRAWPEAELKIVDDAGHASSEPGVVHELVTATDGFRNI
ncbi:MAG: prolyl aminopeptidase [Rhodospirillales bacterium]